MKAKFIVLATLLFSSSTLAQGTPTKPKIATVGGQPLVQVKPTTPGGCKLVGTVKGTKLWAGDCVAAEQLRSGLPAAEADASLPERAAGVIPPGQK